MYALARVVKMSDEDTINLFKDLKGEINGPFAGTIGSFIDDLVEKLEEGEKVFRK